MPKQLYPVGESLSDIILQKARCIMADKFTVELTAEQLDTVIGSLEALYGPATGDLVQYLSDVRNGTCTATCAVCGKSFKAKRHGRPAQYCGRTCAQRAWRARERERRKPILPNR